MEPGGRALNLAPRDVIDAARHPKLLGEGDQPNQHVQSRGIARVAYCQTPARRPVGHFDRVDHAIPEWQNDEIQRRQPRPRRPFGKSGFELGCADRRGRGQRDNLAYSALGSGVDTERLDRWWFPGSLWALIFFDQRRLDPDVDIYDFALHAVASGAQQGIPA